MPDPQTSRSIDLLDSLNGEWLKLPFAAMRDRGPAVQTLGGILSLTGRETFTRAEKIAHAARVPPSTARRHLEALAAGGWIENRGRQQTRSRRLRRTATIAVTQQTRDAAGEAWGVLPWWACEEVRPWAARAVLSVIMAELMKVKAAAESRGEFEGELRWLLVWDTAGPDRFQLPLRALSRTTGLTRESVVDGKRVLQDLHVVEVTGGGNETSGLWPSESFRVIVTPDGDGQCHLLMRSESGDLVVGK